MPSGPHRVGGAVEKPVQTSTPKERVVLRARIVLTTAGGTLPSRSPFVIGLDGKHREHLQNCLIAARFKVTLNTVSKWRKRLFDEGMGGLTDRKGVGWP